MDSLDMLRNADGTRHADGTIYVAGIENGLTSLCTNASHAYYPCVLTPGSPPTATAFSVPDAAGWPVSPMSKVFYSTFKLPNGDQYFYFSGNSVGTYVNIKRSGSWVYANSIKAIDYGGVPAGMAVGDVLYSATRDYYNTQDGQYYYFVMYLSNQLGGWWPTSPVPSFTAGAMSIAFSNDGLTWTQVYDANNPSAYNCTQGVCIEYLGAFRLDNTIYIFAVEGDLAVLAAGVAGNSTMTYLFTAPVSDPLTVTAYNSKAPISNNGIYSPNMPGFHMHNSFINVSCSFNPATGVLYLSRLIPYPWDMNGSIPCDDVLGSSCVTGLATYPNRTQLYSMSLGVPPNINLIYSGTWSLVGDWGFEQGYRSIN